MLVVTGIVAAGWYFWLRPSGSFATAWNSLINPVATIPAGTLSASGTVETTVLSIAPEEPGKVLEVDFHEGDAVKTGQVLVKLDDGVLQIQRNIANANLETAKLGLRQLASPAIIANLQKAIAQDKQAIIDAQQALDIENHFTSNSDAIQSARSNLYLAQVALNNAQAIYDKVKYNNYLDASAKAMASQNVYAAKLAYQNALSVLNLWTGVPNQQQVALKTATLAQANAKLTEDQTLLDMLTGGSIPDNATGAGLAQLQNATINVQSAQASLDLLDDQIGKMTIAAPVDGIVMTRSVDPGNVVNPGTELLSLARLNDLTITVYIPEIDNGKIKLGQNAMVSVDAFPGETFNATVAQISNQPVFLPRTTQTASGSTTTVYAIQLELKDTSGKIKPGMPADVSFVLK